jgi:hypothetical protein
MASGAYWVGETKSISEELAARVAQVACMRTTNMYNSNRRRLASLYGQVGLINYRGNVVMVTSPCTTL